MARGGPPRLSAEAEAQPLQGRQSRIQSARLVTLPVGPGLDSTEVVQDRIVEFDGSVFIRIRNCNCNCIAIASTCRLAQRPLPLDDPALVGLHLLVVIDGEVVRLGFFERLDPLAILVAAAESLELWIVIGDCPRLHLEGLFEIGVGCVDDLARGHLAARDRVVLDDLAHVLHRLVREVVDGDSPKQISDVGVDVFAAAGVGVGVAVAVGVGAAAKTVQPKVDVRRGEALDVEPNVSRPSVLDEVLVLVLVSSDVTGNVRGGQGDVGVGVFAPSPADGVEKDHGWWLVASS
mmetsp:Transcript_20304/g.56470  ORF Transcript_20304/g.56470 Transcript_20304/m.56470 type:complete len:291 (+) Transcript_20304:2-874(+)